MTDSSRHHRGDLTAAELQRLDKKHSCLLRLQCGWWQMGECDFKAAMKRPGEWRDTTLALLAVDQCAAVNEVADEWQRNFFPSWQLKESAQH